MAWSELLDISDFATGRKLGGDGGAGRLMFVVDDDMICECWSGGVEEVTNCFCVCVCVFLFCGVGERERFKGKLEKQEG